MYHRRECRNVQFCCERYRLHLHHVLLDDMLYIGRFIDDMSLSYVDVIRQLAMVTDGVMTFTDFNLFTDDAFRSLTSAYCLIYILFYEL